MPRAGSGGGSHSSHSSFGGHSASRSSGGHNLGSSSRSSFSSRPSTSSRPSAPSRPSVPTTPSRPPIPTPPKIPTQSSPTPISHRPVVPPPPVHTPPPKPVPPRPVYVPPRSTYTPPPPPSPRHYTPSYRGFYVGKRRRYVGYSTFASVFAMIILLCILFVCLFGNAGRPSEPVSIKDREKLSLDIGYNNNCIIDELGWFDNIPSASRGLQTFYDKTGIQPFIVLKAYDSTLTTDIAKQKYAEDWYDEHIDNEGTFLYMYFAEKNQDEDVGYMVYVNGKQISTVMDAEAIDVFWNYLDNQWYTDKTTDDMFVSVFSMTANNIMKHHTNGWDVMKTVIIVACVIGVIVLGIYAMKLHRKHQKERAEETQRILETPLSGSSVDELADKYNS